MRFLSELLRFWRFEGKLSLRREAALAGLLLALLACSSGYELWRVQRDANARKVQVESDRNIIAAVNQLVRGASDVQSGARGFALLRERTILKQYYLGMAEVSAASQSLRVSLADDPAMQKQFASVMQLYVSYLDGSARILISDRLSGNFSGGELKQVVDGNATMEEMRGLLRQMYEKKRTDLQRLEVEWVRSSRQDSRIFSLVTLLTVILGGMGSISFAFRVRRRILDLTSSARAIAAGDFSRPIPTESNREFGDLAEAFNTMVAELDQRRKHDALAKRLWELLHASTSMADVQMTIAQLCPHWIPGSTGVLYLMNPARNLLERCGGWGTLPPSAGQAPGIESFSPGECWALRMGRVHRINGSAHDVHCEHLDRIESSAECVPLMAHGETLGLLLLVLPGVETPAKVAELAEVLAITIASLQMKERMQAAANSDPLTGIYNRRYLDETLLRELARARRHNLPLSLIALDIDHFKNFNDSYGHAAGDMVLKQIARTLSMSLRSSDILCRQGGEEFVVILPHCRVGDAARWAEAARAAVEELSLSFEGKALGPITISAGVASYPEHAATAEHLTAAADRAMYASKAASRNCVTVATVSPVRADHGNPEAMPGEAHRGNVLRVMPPPIQAEGGK